MAKQASWSSYPTAGEILRRLDAGSAQRPSAHDHWETLESCSPRDGHRRERVLHPRHQSPPKLRPRHGRDHVTRATGGKRTACRRKGYRSGDFELLVAEIGDELQGAAEGSDEPVEDIVGGHVPAFDLGDPGDRHAHLGGHLLRVRPRGLRISASRQPRASSSIAATAASKACWPPAVSTARSRWPESRQRDTLLMCPAPFAWYSSYRMCYLP
jgi:hypothetical protein